MSIAKPTTLEQQCAIMIKQCLKQGVPIAFIEHVIETERPRALDPLPVEYELADEPAPVPTWPTAPATGVRKRSAAKKRSAQRS